MKKLALLPLLSLFAVVLTSTNLTFAQPPGDPDAADPGETITGIVAVDGAYVAVGPDFAYPVIGQLPLDAAVMVVGRRGDFIHSWNGEQWLEIVFNDGTAWVYARLIRTSIKFNSIPPTGRRLPRDRNGRVPDVFDLSTNVCNQWQGTYTQSGDFLSGGTEIFVTYPGLQGTTVYSVIAISPSGERVAFDSYDTTATIYLQDLPKETGTYTWRVAPYWANDIPRRSWQQICLLQTGGTFERPAPPEATPTPQP